MTVRGTNYWHADGTEGGVVAAQEIYKATLRDALAPALRGMGYKGSGRLYRLDDDRCWARLGFQASAWSSADHVEFTVNLLVADKAAWSQAREEHPHFPTEPSPGTFYGKAVSWQQRLGRLMPAGRDEWWRINDERSAEQVATEVLGAIREFGHPALLSERSLISGG